MAQRLRNTGRTSPSTPTFCKLNTFPSGSQRRQRSSSPPTLTYHYYPAFTEYPGSTTLRLQTARDLVVDVCCSLASHGPRRFYVLNTGISTIEPLAQSAALLAHDGILLRFTDARVIESAVASRIIAQPFGTHAGEAETSKLLYIAPDRVDMSKAVRDCNPEERPGGLSRTPGRDGVYSPSGIWGDPTLATAEKGLILVEAMVRNILLEIQAVEAAPLPRE